MNKAYWILAIAAIGIHGTAGAQSSREMENFDNGWQFHLGNFEIGRAVKSGKYGGITDWTEQQPDQVITIAYNDKDKAPAYNPQDWRDVSLPHDWCVEQPFVNDASVVVDGAPKGLVSHGFLPVGIGFYRKEFSIPEEDLGKIISIEFEGIFRNSTVWVNGHLLGSHPSGYIPSCYNLTDVLRYGDEGRNVILVRVDARDFEGWWYEGAGIYRHVWLQKTSPLHVARFGTFVTTPVVSENKAVVAVETTVQNDLDHTQDCRLAQTITDAGGNIVARFEADISVSSCDSKVIRQSTGIDRPLLWSPETPDLYQLLTRILVDGKEVDRYTTTFGVRTVEMRADGFYLNGRLYPLKGTVNHQDHAGLGVALPDKVNRYRVRLLKEMGSNAYRTGHHAPTPALLDICDEQGMLFLDENRMLSSSESGLKDLETLIKRDRNHPSVFMWCLENEESIEGTPIAGRILQTMKNLVRKLDPTRQVTAAMNHGWNEGNYSKVLDVVGYNYGQRNNQYRKDHKAYPERRMLVTETASFVATRGEYADDFKKGYVSNLGNGVGWGTLPGKDWADYVDCPYLGGIFAWTGFDYRGEPTPIYKWPSVTSHFGIMDMCGFPKDGYYAYKAAWNEKPVVHVFPHWNWPDNIGKTMKVMGFTNCEEVELLVNGKTMGRKSVKPYERMEWEVTYQPGYIEARGYRKGRLVAKERTETTGTARNIVLKSDVPALKADGQDVAIINVAVTDGKGRVVPTADNRMEFAISGPGRIIGTGNGCPSSTEPDKAPRRKAFNGYCQVLVQSDTTDGAITVTVTSQGLKPATIRLDSK